MGMMEVDRVVSILTTIIYDAALPNQPAEPYSQWPSAPWGRVEVMQNAFSFLVSLSYSTDQVKPALCNNREGFTKFLKRIILEAPEVRK